MEKATPLKIEILSSDSDDQYCITTRREIEFILQNIAKGGALIALYFSESNDFVLTRLLGVDATGLWLEQRPVAKENEHVLESRKLVFVCSHAQVKVQFTSEHAAAATYQGRPAFFISFPDHIYRLQRREYFRLTTPVSTPLRCVIPGAETVHHNPHEVTIMDISGGGVGLTCTEQDTVLIPGQTYQDCRIELPEIGEFYGTIEIKNLVRLSTASGQTVRRAGCEFKNLDGASTIMLQRYVTTMQRMACKIKD